MFDGGSKKGRCASQLNERVAYSTRCTPSFTKSGTAHTLVVLFFSPSHSAPLNGSPSSVRAVLCGALIQHPSTRPWDRAPPSSGRARGICTLMLHCRPQKSPRTHAHGPALAGLSLLRTSLAAKRRPRAAGMDAGGVLGLFWTAKLRNFVPLMRLHCLF